MPIRRLILALLFTLIPLAGCSDQQADNITMIRELVSVAKDAKLKGRARVVHEGAPISWSTQTAIGTSGTVTGELDFDFTEGDD